MDKLLRELLIADKVGHRLVKPLLERFCEIHSDSEQRINSLVEIISDIRQPINEQSTQTPRSKEKQRHLEVKVSAVITLKRWPLSARSPKVAKKFLLEPEVLKLQKSFCSACWKGGNVVLPLLHLFSLFVHLIQFLIVS